MAHKLVTESMVERAADAMYHDPQNLEPYEKESIRAALEAVADEIVEAWQKSPCRCPECIAIERLKSQGQ
jgi:hypothetical protein